MSTDDSRRRLRVAIREMEIDDLSDVYHLGSRLFTSGELPTLYRTWDEYEVTTFFNTDTEYCLVADVDGEVAGFVLGTTYEKDGSAWKYGYVAWIGVKPEHRGQKLGHRLYQELERRMAEDGVRIMLMDTEAGNKAAISFFSRMGFGRPEPQVWMSKTLRREASPANGAVRRHASPARSMRLALRKPAEASSAASNGHATDRALHQTVKTV
ncbi:MAG: GNAT family N-acetyltransferase [Chloroflexi bacterium]|nr:GNAT family N-acetyltransferase [Chloroflexota bacterium]